MGTYKTAQKLILGGTYSCSFLLIVAAKIRGLFKTSVSEQACTYYYRLSKVCFIFNRSF